MRTKYTHVTKELVESEFAAGKTAAQIEREQGMSHNSLYAKLKGWGIQRTKSNDEGQPRSRTVSLPPITDRRPLDMRIDDITADVVLELRRWMGRSVPLSCPAAAAALINARLVIVSEELRQNNLLHARLEMITVAALAMRYLHDLPINHQKEGISS